MIDGRQDLSSKLSRKKNLFFCLLSPSFALHLQLVEIRCGLFPSQVTRQPHPCCVVFLVLSIHNCLTLSYNFFDSLLLQ
ncbi:hypothetical protein G4B88_023210 [Cannabis sativa]|uniref:Uncharacterized protein n=1 Tax=Cannabis sativa TaxID=3483 RepID=A0A7J6E0H1_CANSA|nr:hypothetical protein G4B88_023210 [Cannabis sativa]